MNDRLYAIASVFAVVWLATDDARWSFCATVLAATAYEVVTRTRAGLRNLAELRRLERAVAVAREGVE